MQRVALLSLLLALGWLLAAPAWAPAQQTLPAKWYRPNHVMANPQTKACPGGYSRLFGRNPPTCYQNCQPGYSVHSHHTSGAKCVRCPQGYFVTAHPSGGFTCTRSPNQGVFGQ